MSYIVVDVEADGDIPYKYSMVCFGAVIVEPGLTKTFYGRTKPLSDMWKPENLAISGFSREEHLAFDKPKVVMAEFDNWIKANSKGRPIFVSDNVAFDWQWINFYFHWYLGRNPFGFSGTRLGDIYCGIKLDAYANRDWKRKYRKTTHDHNPVNDAMGNAEALLAFKNELGLKIRLE